MECRYEKSSSFTHTVLVSPVIVSKIVTSTTASLVSNPKHPAFPATAPPTVPGSHIHFPKREFSCVLDTWSDNGDMSSPAPARTFPSLHSIHLSIFRTIIPSNTSNAKTTLVPLPRNTTGSLSSLLHFHMSWSFGISECSRSSKKYCALAGVWNDEYFKRSLFSSRNGSIEFYV